MLQNHNKLFIIFGILFLINLSYVNGTATGTCNGDAGYLLCNTISSTDCNRVSGCTWNGENCDSPLDSKRNPIPRTCANLPKDLCYIYGSGGCYITCQINTDCPFSSEFCNGNNRCEYAAPPTVTINFPTDGSILSGKGRPFLTYDEAKYTYKIQYINGYNFLIISGTADSILGISKVLVKMDDHNYQNPFWPPGVDFSKDWGVASGTNSWTKLINLDLSEERVHSNPYNPSEDVSHTIKIKSVDNSGQESSELSVKFYYNPPPDVDINIYPSYYVNKPGRILFTVSDSTSIYSYTNENNNLLTIRWDFNGDGNWDTPFVNLASLTAIGSFNIFYLDKSYTYKTSGYKNIILEVKDKDGGDSVYNKQIYVYDKCSDSCNPFDNNQVCDNNIGYYTSCPSTVPICFKGKCTTIDKNDILTLSHTIVGLKHDSNGQAEITDKCRTTGIYLDPSLPECPDGTRTIYNSILGTFNFRDIGNSDSLIPEYSCKTYTLCKNDPDYSELKYRDIEFKEGSYGPFTTDPSSTISPDPGCDPGFSLLRPLTFDYMNYTFYNAARGISEKQEYAKKIVNLCVKTASAYGNYVTDIKIQNSGGISSYYCSDPSTRYPLKDCSTFGDGYYNVGDFGTESQNIFFGGTDKTRCSQTRVCAKRLCEDECSQNKCSNDKLQVCGNYDSDPCLELSAPQDCGNNQICYEGSCRIPTDICLSTNGKVNCEIKNTCDKDEVCVVGLNQEYNSHVSECSNKDSLKTCCKITTCPSGFTYSQASGKCAPAFAACYTGNIGGTNSELGSLCENKWRNPVFTTAYGGEISQNYWKDASLGNPNQDCFDSSSGINTDACCYVTTYDNKEYGEYSSIAVKKTSKIEDISKQLNAQAVS